MFLQANQSYLVCTWMDRRGRQGSRPSEWWDSCISHAASSYIDFLSAFNKTSRCMSSHGAASMSHDEWNPLWMSVIEHQGFIIKETVAFIEEEVIYESSIVCLNTAFILFGWFIFFFFFYMNYIGTFSKKGFILLFLYFIN